MCNWDVDQLEGMRDDIVKGDKLKFTMDVCGVLHLCEKGMGGCGSRKQAPGSNLVKIVLMG